MPIIDYDDELTTAGGQAVTATAIGTRVKDGRAAKDWGAGEELYAYARVTSDAASNPTTSMTITIEGADDAALTTNAVVLATTTVLVAALTANSLHRIGELKPGSNKRYLGCRFTPNGGDATTGKFKVGLIPCSARPQDGVHFL